MSRTTQALHLEAQTLNRRRDYDAATERYAMFRAADTAALDMAARRYYDSVETAAANNLEVAAAVWQGWRAPLSTCRGGGATNETVMAAARARVWCVAGAVVGDAAAMGVQWVYDPAHLQRLLNVKYGGEKPPHLQRQFLSAADDDGNAEGADAVAETCCQNHARSLAFHPPQNMHFVYDNGRNSPYGEQLLVRG